MSTKVPSPLVDVAMSYVSDVNPELNPDILEHIRMLFDGYINETVTYEKISYELNKHIDNLTPLEKICSILSIPLVPQPTSSPIQQTINISTKIDDNGRHRSNSYNSNLNGKDFSPSTTPTGKSRKKTRSWTEDEDQRLLMGVHLHGLENWTLVAQFVGNNRTRSMCSQRWIRVLDPKISKNHWTEEEDQQLLQLIQLYGEKSWMKISSKLGNRSDVQCRYHYRQLQRESKDTSDSSPSPTSSAQYNVHKPQIQQKSQIPQQSIFPAPMSFNYNFQSPSFSSISKNSTNITPSPSSMNSNGSISTKVVENPSQVPKQETQNKAKNDIFNNLFDLPLKKQELQFRLDEPFGIEESFDFFKTDPMFNDSFWTY